MSADRLAFVGDAVFELIIRQKIISEYGLNIGEINNLKTQLVCCEAQAEFFKILEPYLTEREIAVYKRGRNAHIGNVPKKSSPQIYHISTGLEATFGYLYLSNQIERIEKLFSHISL